VTLRDTLPRFAQHETLARFSGRLDSYVGWIIGHATLIDVDPLHIAAIILVESEGIPTAYNKGSKATGLMQVMPREAGAVFRDRPRAAELLDPAMNIRWGCQILAAYLKREGGNLRRAVWRYSGGTTWASFELYEQRYWSKVERYHAALVSLATPGAPAPMDEKTVLAKAVYFLETAARAAQEEGLDQVHDWLVQHSVRPAIELRDA
jgi:soluble lytic murein transglycosylase-like protein